MKKQKVLLLAVISFILLSALPIESTTTTEKLTVTYQTMQHGSGGGG
ncbi:hypothetical protein [Paenibacillus tepidiphilus]|nr:hypothetical protein [Paenibacillus tepidiphilus]